MKCLDIILETDLIFRIVTLEKWFHRKLTLFIEFPRDAFYT